MNKDAAYLVTWGVGLVFSVLAALLWHWGHPAWAIFIITGYLSNINAAVARR